MKTQEEDILEWLQEGRTLTALDALREFQCMRCGARIYDLKQKGYNIVTEMVSYENYKGVKKTIAQYRLIKPPSQKVEQLDLI